MAKKKEDKITSHFISKSYREFYPEGNYVYKMIDHQGEIVYIGKTKNILQRYMMHKNAHNTCKPTKIPYEDVCKIHYLKFDSEYLATIYEIHLINKYKPVGNKSFLFNEDNSKDILDLKEDWWEVLLPLDLVDSIYRLDSVIFKMNKSQIKEVILNCMKDTIQINNYFDEYFFEQNDMIYNTTERSLSEYGEDWKNNSTKNI